MESEHETLDLRKHSKYFFIGSFLLIIVLSIILVRSFLSAIFGAIVLAYLFYPLYDFLLRKTKMETLSALIISILVLIILVLPFIVIGNAVFNETADLFFSIRQINFEEISEKYIDQYLQSVVGENFDVGGVIKDSANKFSILLIQRLDGFVLDLPKKILSAFIMIFLMFYLFKDGKRLLFTIKEALPLKKRYREDLAKKFNNTIYATMYGIVVTAIIQGIIGAIGFWIFDVDSPLIWGLVMTFFAMLPFIGTGLIWLPAVIFKLAVGDTGNAIGLLIYGVFLISSIDNLIRPKIIGSRSKVHPALVLLGAFGGVSLFGLIGIIVGPLILAILSVFFDLYLSEEYESV